MKPLDSAPQDAYHFERCRCRVKWAMGDDSFDSDGSSVDGKVTASPTGSRPTKSERCGCAKCQAGRKTLPHNVVRASHCGSNEDAAAIPEAVSLGFGLSELAHNQVAHSFQNPDQQQVKTLTTDQRILLIHQTAKALNMSSSAPTTKTFGKSTRSVPHSTEKAQKWYPAEDEAKPRKVRGCIHFQS